MPEIDDAVRQCVFGKPIKFHVVVRPNDPTRGYLMVECGRGYMGHCPTPLWRGEPSGIMWQWDGNTEKPTIRPSINCQGGCYRHFTVTNGVAA